MIRLEDLRLPDILWLVGILALSGAIYFGLTSLPTGLVLIVNDANLTLPNAGVFVAADNITFMNITSITVAAPHPLSQSELEAIK
jgi:hypothetical protein